MKDETNPDLAHVSMSLIYNSVFV